MHRTLTVLFGLAAAAMLPSASVTAGVQSPAATAGLDQASAVERVQYWDIGRCRAWRRECADRWGWRSGRWHRCMARHGCERYHYGDRWD